MHQDHNILATDHTNTEEEVEYLVENVRSEQHDIPEEEGTGEEGNKKSYQESRGFYSSLLYCIYDFLLGKEREGRGCCSTNGTE